MLLPSINKDFTYLHVLTSMDYNVLQICFIAKEKALSLYNNNITTDHSMKPFLGYIVVSNIPPRKCLMNLVTVLASSSESYVSMIDWRRLPTLTRSILQRLY